MCVLYFVLILVAYTSMSVPDGWRNPQIVYCGRAEILSFVELLMLRKNSIHPPASFITSSRKKANT